ncbi:ALPHA/BETA-HYDROLASES SUPERFAMILY PROTEIN [Salix purpurea]|uniref:ALPHA/BETA-HYDROLASES SUPERFAMILY PROTEIN n=1 Tax=Salix purpurea TaxID=77065 RepID=A0A9Q0Q1D5_SALPP|nr:ALPHA/BETA-HYDROLASES SUPERFAMILY PROTEIN [Salix purpurea]
MAPSFLSFASLYSFYLRHCFTSSGLSQKSINVGDETTIHFWAPTQLRQSKPNLVFIHGFGPVSLWQWRQQVQFFAPDFNLYVPDLIFFGDSTTKSSERSEIFQAESVAKLLETLGVEKYSLVGTSYGGRNWRKIDDLMLPQKPSDLRALLGVAVSKPSLLMVPDFFLNDVINKLFAENRNKKVELLSGLTIGHDGSVNISPLQQDVLLVWGDKDQIFPLEMAKDLQGLIGKNVRLEIIKDTSHDFDDGGVYRLKLSMLSEVREPALL